MPLCKEVPNLKSLCLDNIARNIVRHGKKFRKSREGEDIFALYKTLQYIHTDDLSEKLFAMFKEEENCANKKFNEFKNFVFGENVLGNLERWPCLKLIFNEYTTSTPLLLAENTYRSKAVIPKEIFSHISSQCKNLKKVDLGISDTTEVFVKILEMCPLIRKLSADFSGLLPGHRKMGNSDDFLLSLCKHRRGNEFNFCPENGNCSSIGKRLESMRVLVSHTTGAGIACALQHLPLLRDFVKLPTSLNLLRRTHTPNVVRGVNILQNSAANNERPPIMLQLTEISVDEYSNTEDIQHAFSCCPKLETLQMDLTYLNSRVFRVISSLNIQRLHLHSPRNQTLSSVEFREFLSTRGEKLNSLSFALCIRELCLSADWCTFLNDIFEKCPNLEELLVDAVADRDSNTNHDHIQYFPGLVTNMKRLNIYLDYNFPELCAQNFCELLCRAKNARSLDIDIGYTANAQLAHAIQNGDFRMLEKLCIRSADVSEIPLHKLINTKNNLRKLHLYDCRNSDSFIKQWKNLAKMNNYELEIKGWQDIFRDIE